MAAAARRATSLLALRGGGRAGRLAGLGQRRGLAALADNEVAINILAAPVTAADLAGAGGKGTDGVGVVTGVGAKVKSVAVNDWIVAASPSVGA